MGVRQITQTNVPRANVGTIDIVDGTIAAADIANGAVTAGKLGALAVTTAKIDDLAVTTGKLAANAVTSEKLATAVTNVLAIVSNIPTTDPAIAGRVWNDNGVLKSSAGA